MQKVAAETKAEISKEAHLLQLLLGAELVRPAALLLAAVGGLDGKASVAPKNTIKRNERENAYSIPIATIPQPPLPPPTTT